MLFHPNSNTRLEKIILFERQENLLQIPHCRRSSKIFKTPSCPWEERRVRTKVERLTKSYHKTTYIYAQVEHKLI